MRETIRYLFDKGYKDTDNRAIVEDGSIIYPSSNGVYEKNGKLKSFKEDTQSYAYGGSRAFNLGKNAIGFLGTNVTSGKATGNMIQGIGRSLWFVGNAVTSGVKIYNNTSQTVIGNLSSIPQLAKYNGSGWDSPYQVGLSAQVTAPELILTNDSTRGGDFAGIINGSISCRLARERDGTVSIASENSNVVTGKGDSVYVTVPAIPADDSDTWYLYFTFHGEGSLQSHWLFPIEMLETQLDTTDTPVLYTDGNAKAKVVSQHASTQASRKIEVEFYSNDLLLLAPSEDNYPLGACKFIAQLGNVMLGIGTGSDNTGLDISFPNNHQAYTPDWREWFAEEPVAIAQDPENGFIWVLGHSSVYQLIWSGAESQSAPVIIRQVTSKYGAIGEGCAVVVNGDLYFISSGNLPVRITPDRKIDDTFGRHIKDSINTWDSTTQAGYYESLNSVVWMNGTTSFQWQIDNQIWGAPCTTTRQGYAMFDYDGGLYFCDYNSGFKTRQWNSGGNPAWSFVSSFRGGEKAPLNLKDIIETRAIVGADLSHGNDTVTLTAFKDFDTSSGVTIRSFTGADGTLGSTKIIERQFSEKHDYETISIKASGTKGGQTVYLVSVEVDIHEIDRVS